MIGLVASLSHQSSAVVGGYTPTADEYRFDAVAAFGRPNQLVGPVSFNNHFGAGTLIDCEWMLVARHLLSWSNATESHQYFDTDFYLHLPPAEHFWFRFRRNPDGTLGAVNTTSPDLGASTFYHVEAVEYILPTQQFTGLVADDMALVRLANPITHIEPMRVGFEPDSAFTGGVALTLASWGKEWPEGCVFPDPPGPPVCPCGGSNFPRSRRLKVAETIVQSGAVGQFWDGHCNAVCECGAVEHDSGGAVLKELPCGRVELVGVISTAGQGANLWWHQNNPAFPIYVYTPPCPADLNDDGLVDGGDLGLLLLEWGTPGCIGEEIPCTADLDCNGTVDGSDIGIFLLAWGPCPLLECGQSSMMGGGGASAQGGASSSESDSFYQWALQAGLEELFEWLEDFFLTGND